MSGREFSLGRGVAWLALAIALPAAGIEGARLVRGNDGHAELRVAQRLGATIEHRSSAGLVPNPAGHFVITSVATVGPARAGGLEVGDVILAADEQPLRSLADLERAIPVARPSRFTIDRQGRELQMMVPTQGRAPGNAGGGAVPQAADR